MHFFCILSVWAEWESSWFHACKYNIDAGVRHKVFLVGSWLLEHNGHCTWSRFTYSLVRLSIFLQCIFICNFKVFFFSFFFENSSVCHCQSRFLIFFPDLSFWWLFSLSLFLFCKMTAGFYICWGCLVWVPSVYTSPGMYLVNHPVNLGLQVLCCFHLFDFQFNCPVFSRSLCFKLRVLNWSGMF